MRVLPGLSEAGLWDKCVQGAQPAWMACPAC